jgi:E3 SUMO-protein ligase NSE2
LQWFQLKDFFDDQLIIRKLQRMQKASAQVDDDDDDEDDARPRGTQRNRPTQIDDDSDESVNVQEERRKTIKKVKREKQSLMKVASSVPVGEDVDAMDTD